MRWQKHIAWIIAAIVLVLTCAAIPSGYTVDEDRFIIHTVKSGSGKLKLYWKDGKGKPYGSIQRLKDRLTKEGKKLVFAMNGGMYTATQDPLGLYIEDGVVKQKMNRTKTAHGNFYLQPNGIFCIMKDGKGKVIKTTDYKTDADIRYATQSGPMLLIDGAYHPKLTKGSKNFHVRNAVGILPNGDMLFVMSKKKVNFYDLATLFKQKGCKNALYLDGFVSRTYLPSQGSVQTDGHFGVIIGEVG